MPTTRSAAAGGRTLSLWGVTRVRQSSDQTPKPPPALYVVGDPSRRRTKASVGPQASTVRTVPTRLTAAERRRLQRSGRSPEEAASQRLDAAARRRSPGPLGTAEQRADNRLVDAERAKCLREPATEAERADERLAAATRRQDRRGLLSDERLTERRLQDAARQRRRRNSMTEAERAAERLADASRKAALRSSPAYAALTPEAKWKVKGRRGQPPRERPFVGVDGEAGYVHDPWCARETRGWCECRQHYAALTAGDKTLSNPDGRPLSTWQCLEFLTSLPPARYVGYFFDFDATKILADLSLHVLQDIVYPDGIRTPRSDKSTLVRDPITRRMYLIRYVPHKFLKVVRVGDLVGDTPPGKKPRRVGGRSIVVNDCAGYWQTSFHGAITTWGVGTAEELAVIQEWKAKRSDFTLPLAREVVDYNLLECKLLAELMTKLDRTAVALGIRLERYHGAGTLAEALLKKHGVDAFRSDGEAREPDLDHAIMCAYFGGRFESAVVGVVPTLHVWDIASAYPAAMVTLPCLRHGHWIHHKRSPPLTRLADSAMVYVRWDVYPSEQRPFGPLPYRRGDQELLYPLSGEGWHWVEEVRAAMNYSGVDGCRVMP